MSEQNPAARIPDGYSHLSPGKVVSVVTYLQNTAIATRPMPAAAPGFSVARFDGNDLAAYRALFRRVGTPWLWYKRLQHSDEELRTVLCRGGVETYILQQGFEALGLLELDFRQPGEAELVYLGVATELVGRGAGKYLMEFALHRVGACNQRQPLRRFWLHTCSFDHPRALAFYQRMGFRPYARAIEVSDDPRLLGLLPRDAAPHVPLIEPGT